MLYSHHPSFSNRRDWLHNHGGFSATEGSLLFLSNISIGFASTQEFAHLTRQEVPAQHQGNSTYSSHPIWTFELAAMAVELLVMALRQSAARSIPREAKAVVGKKISMNRVDQSNVGPLSDGAGSEYALPP